MKSIVKFQFSSDGKCIVEIDGVNGPSCLQQIEEVCNDLGFVPVGGQHKPEFHKKPDQKQSLNQ